MIRFSSSMNLSIYETPEERAGDSLVLDCAPPATISQISMWKKTCIGRAHVERTWLTGITAGQSLAEPSFSSTLRT